MTEAKLLSDKEQIWTDVLQRTRHDFYHLPSYCRFAATQSNGTPVALYAVSDAGECLIPLVLQRIPASLSDASWYDGFSPYAYGSPLFAGEISTESARQLFEECINEGARRDIISVFIRMHPLLGQLDLDRAANAIQVVHGDTVYVDLTRPHHEYERGLASGHSYEIRRLRKLGFTTGFDQWERLQDFGALYRQTMLRVGAGEGYLFDYNYFFALRETLGEHLHLCLTYAADQNIAAGALFSNYKGLMQYHLSGTADGFLRLAPTKLVLDDIIGWGRERHARQLHLGGGVGGREDSLFRFKAGFSSDRATFRTLRIVASPEKYQKVCQQWDALPGNARTRSSDYFPLYRQQHQYVDTMQDTR